MPPPCVVRVDIMRTCRAITDGVRRASRQLQRLQQGGGGLAVHRSDRVAAHRRRSVGCAHTSGGNILLQSSRLPLTRATPGPAARRSCTSCRATVHGGRSSLHTPPSTRPTSRSRHPAGILMETSFPTTTKGAALMPIGHHHDDGCDTVRHRH